MWCLQKTDLIYKDTENLKVREKNICYVDVQPKEGWCNFINIKVKTKTITRDKEVYFMRIKVQFTRNI